MIDATVINAIGTACFGAVIGWCVYYSMRRWDNYGPSQLGVLITAVLGGAVSSFFAGTYNVGAYGVGVATGFFLYAFWAQRFFGESSSKNSKGGSRESVFKANERKENPEAQTEEYIPASDLFKKKRSKKSKGG